jgi:hypothetical protein
MRWRTVGLKAVKSVASSEALASVAGRQLNVIMPMLLENIWTDNLEYLDVLQRRAEIEEKVDVEKMLRRRTSIGTVRTATSDTNPAALSASTADADRSAEEDIGVLAVQCLKQIFQVNNRSQVYAATGSIIKFISERVSQGETLVDTSSPTGKDHGWATSVFLMVSRWAPVQDRYIILVASMEALTSCPIRDQDLEQQLVLATMVSSLLSSDINLIGLSVMDVLLGLIQQILRILQLGGSDPLQQTTGPFADLNPALDVSKGSKQAAGAAEPPIVERASTPTDARLELLNRLQHCIGDLATHVYYADQLSDMIAAILLRLKPAATSAVPTAVAAIEDPEAASNAVTASANITEDPRSDEFFSFDTAKVTALRAIKSIMLVATRKSMSGAASLGRNRVGIHVWEGTQWLLRDPDGRVRKAYVDALLTWLHREMTKADLRVFEDKSTHHAHKALLRNGGDDSTTSLSKRAISNASKPPKPPKSTFLRLIHLAIYENVLQYVDSEADIVLLYILLVSLVDTLGVNAVRSGLPMISRLQEDIQDVDTIAKVRMGSLCHGYFSAIVEKFGLDDTAIAREIQGEVARRRSHGLWVDKIRYPPMTLDQLESPGTITTLQLPIEQLESEVLIPFDNRDELVEQVAIAYSESLGSPPASPPQSPSAHRSGSQPTLTTHHTSEHQLPPRVKEEMLSDWSKDSVVAGLQESSRSGSLNGSRGNGSGRHHLNFLAVNGALGNDGTNSGTHSPKSPHYLHLHHHLHNSRPPSQNYGLTSALGNALRSSHGKADTPVATSDSSRNSVTRVDQLKRVLSGQTPPSRGFHTAYSDGSSDSMVSYEGGVSDYSGDNRGLSNTGTPRISTDVPRSKSRERQSSSDHLSPLTSNPVNTSLPVRSGSVSYDTVPPVPPIPTSLNQERKLSLGIAVEDFGIQDSRELKSRGGRASHDSAWADESTRVMDLQELLDGIGTDDGIKTSNGNVAVPPY